MHPRADRTPTGTWHGETGVQPGDVNGNGHDYAFARASCQRCGQTVERRASTTDLASTLLATAMVAHHCETWDVTGHTAREARRVVRDWWRDQDRDVWKDALVTAALVCVVGLLLLRAWQRW